MKAKGVIEVEIVGLRCDDGEVVCALYDRAEAFPSEGKAWGGTQASITDRHALCRFEGVPPGRYAVAAFHDEDGDRKLRVVFGMPRDGYGFSNDAKPGMLGPPEFAAAAFNFDGQPKRLTIRLHYP